MEHDPLRWRHVSSTGRAFGETRKVRARASGSVLNVGKILNSSRCGSLVHATCERGERYEKSSNCFAGCRAAGRIDSGVECSPAVASDDRRSSESCRRGHPGSVARLSSSPSLAWSSLASSALRWLWLGPRHRRISRRCDHRWCDRKQQRCRRQCSQLLYEPIQIIRSSLGHVPWLRWKSAPLPLGSKTSK